MEKINKATAFNVWPIEHGRGPAAALAERSLVPVVQVRTQPALNPRVIASEATEPGAIAMQSRCLFLGAALLIAAAGPALTADSAGKQSVKGAVVLNDGTKISQNPSLPKLTLTNSQREQIRKAVLTEHNEVEFQLKATKSAKDFVPAVGAKLPKGITGHSLPQGVLSQIPQLRDYKYVKMKDEVLIVNGMTKKIVDMFPETQPLS